MEEQLYTPSEAARELGVKYDTLMHWIYRGKVDVVTLDRKPIQFLENYRITQTTLDNLRNSIIPSEERRTARSPALRKRRLGNNGKQNT